jgi:predicted glycoside hydrolase/deacetylase ChbG (UPF0249 family)
MARVLVPVSTVMRARRGAEVSDATAHRLICVCVDDVGLHPGIDAAAFDLVELGRVHALACMVGAPGWPAVAARLRPHAEAIDIGLHLDFTEHPLTAAARSGLARLIASTYLHLASPRKLRAEVRAQFDAFSDRMDRMPAFVDGHQHVHQLPALRDILIEELELRRSANPASSTWLRSTRRTRGDRALRSDWRSEVKRELVEVLGARGLRRLATQRGFAQNRALLGVYDFRTGHESYATAMEAWLSEAENGDLLMCHPSVAAVATDPIANSRAAEFALLGSPLFDRMLRHARVMLAPMSRILAEATPVQEVR